MNACQYEHAKPSGQERFPQRLHHISHINIISQIALPWGIWSLFSLSSRSWK
jgi:hypothetical protein